MKILIISKDLAGIPIGMRCQSEGNKVLIFQPKGKRVKAGKGLIDITLSEQAARAFQADFTVFDSTGLGVLAERWPGFSFGGSKLHDALEYERDDSLGLCEACGIKLPKGFSTKSYSEAKSYVRKVNKPVVIKLNGEKFAGSSATYVSKSAEDAQEMLDLYSHKFHGVDIVLQEKIQGKEISSSGFFLGEKFAPTFYHTLERKKLLTGDLGPNVGCAGDVVWNVQANDIIRKGLLKLEPALAKAGFYGEIDLNTIVDERGSVYALELTPRFGYNASLSWFTTLRGDTSSLLEKLAKRTLKDIPAKEGWGTSVSLSIPPFPNKTTEIMSEDVPVLGLDEENEVWFNIFDLWKDDKGNYATSGYGGWIGSPAVFDKSLDKALEENLTQIKKLIIPNLGYRTDIGQDAKEVIKALSLDT